MIGRTPENRAFANLIRMITQSLKVLRAGHGLVLLVIAIGCADDSPVPTVDEAAVQSQFVEVVGCKHSHEHELRHVQILADTESADVFERCVLEVSGTTCIETGFAPGAAFVKYEYEFADCVPTDLVSITSVRKLQDGEFPDGRDWHWQRLTPGFRVVEDGAPERCVTCHLDHCSGTGGFDLRCVPD